MDQYQFVLSDEIWKIRSVVHNVWILIEKIDATRRKFAKILFCKYACGVTPISHILHAFDDVVERDRISGSDI